MEYKLLGRSGLRVSELCLGTMTFGEDWGWGANKKESREIFDLFAQAGGNFVDTADGYTNGTSEKWVGEFVRADRNRFVISTKYSFNQRTGDPNAGGNHRKNMVQALEGSLKRLQLDNVDVYIVHAWDQLTPIEEVMRAMDDMVRAGKVLYAGVSNLPAWLIASANVLAEMRGWTPFINMQIEYSLIERTPERELLPMAQAHDVGVTAWSPLASGILSGKYTSEKESEPKRLEKAEFKELSERNLAIARVVQKVADLLRRTPAQVALNWVRQRHNIIPIIGARTAEQMRENLGCLEFTLSPPEMQVLDEVSRIEMGYPYDFLQRESVHERLHGGTFSKIRNHRAKAGEEPKRETKKVA